MEPELESDSYDVVVIGTGVAESIAAAALAKAGKSVLHLDPNYHYGGQQASLTLDELVAWASNYGVSSTTVSEKTGVSYSRASTSALTPELEADRRRYSLSLFPAVIPSRGALIDVLIASEVSKYIEFKLLDSVNIWDEITGEIRKVPGSKEDVFKDKSVGLLEKRKLMKFLMFATGKFETDDILKGKESQPLIQFMQESFSLSEQLATSIAYAISHCTTSEEETLSSLQRTRRYLRSVGRYGSSAFLVGHYGGAGEMAQGFCRGCAVFGGTYVLGPSAKPTSMEMSEAQGKLTIQLPCHPRPITASHLISSPDHIPPSLVTIPKSGDIWSAHCIALSGVLPKVLDRQTIPSDDGEEGEVESVENNDTSLVVFPPAKDSPLVRCLVNGEGTGSCPQGQYIIYLTSSALSTSSPREALKPYLERLGVEPLFESYYLSTRPTISSIGNRSVVILAPYAGSEPLTEGLDWEAKEGEKAYYAVMGYDGKKFFDKAEAGEEAVGLEQDNEI